MGTAYIPESIKMKDTDGTTLDVSPANTARTTGTVVLPVQVIDSAGNVISTINLLVKGDLNLDGDKDLQVDVKSLPSITGAVTTDALKSSELSIDGSKYLAVNVKAMPSLTGSVTTDALKASELNIEALTKNLNVIMKWVDTTGAALGFKNSDGLPRFEAKPYYTSIGEGYVSGHTAWSKIGYNGALVASTEADVWSKTGSYTFPTTASTMRLVSSSAGDEDTGVIIKSGTSTGGTTISLIDTTGGVNFNGVVAVEVGDCILLDKASEGGRTPEWGFVSAVTSNTELAVAGGFSSLGTGSGRTYSIVDKVLTATPKTGAQCWKVDYLDYPAYTAKTEMGVFDGNATVATVGSMWRINSFRVIATGTGNKPVGDLTLDNAGGTVYSFITKGFTRARNAAYTVPAGKTLCVTSWTTGYAYGHNSTHYCRIYTRANVEPSTGFNTGSIFYPFTEVLLSNNTFTREFEIPTKLPAKTDIRVSALADYTGVVTTALRGWLE